MASKKSQLNTQNKKIVVIGGGTGPFNILRGLADQENVDITTVFTTWDSGGSTGKMRTELGVLPKGDARRHLIALIRDPQKRQLILELFEHRISISGTNHAIGNLMLTSLDQIYGGDGLEQMKILLDIKANIIGVTVNALTLGHKDLNGNEAYGEHMLDSRSDADIYDPTNSISSIFFSTKPRVNEEAVKAVREADIIVLSPGSLYGSVLPNLLVSEFKKAIVDSKAKLFFVLNVMTEPGQTDNFTASDHIKELNRYLGNSNRLDYLIAHENHINREVLEIYRREFQEPVLVDDEECVKLTPKLKVLKGHFANYLPTEHLLRHDPEKITAAILDPESFLKKAV